MCCCNRKKGLPAIADSESVVLVVGTMPSDASLTLQAYYADNRNEFWKVLSIAYGEDIPGDAKLREAFLRGKRIAVWDVLRCCIREGSGDGGIGNPIANDFAEFWSEHPAIRAVFANGEKPKTLYDLLVNDGKTLRVLPGTSSANRHLTAEGKAEVWRQLREYTG